MRGSPVLPLGITCLHTAHAWTRFGTNAADLGDAACVCIRSVLDVRREPRPLHLVEQSHRLIEAVCGKLGQPWLRHTRADGDSYPSAFCKLLQEMMGWATARPLPRHGCTGAGSVSLVGPGNVPDVFLSFPVLLTWNVV